MRWFKHDADAHRDPRLRRLRREHGLEGVGLYWSLLEMIVADVDQNNFTFQLEQDSSMIAEDVGIPQERVENMMRTMLELELFESSYGVITCLKLLKRMDASQVKSPTLRELIKEKKIKLLDEGHDPVMTRSWWGHDRTEQNRTEQNLANQGKGSLLPNKPSSKQEEEIEF